MALDKDFELTAHAGEIHEVDEIAAQEAVEDARTKAEQGEAGGGLDRYINLVSAINFSFVLQASWTGAATTFQFSLSNGGPASIAYGSIFAGIGTTLIAFSLAEMSSMDPTVGAQYRWTATFAPKFKRFFGLMQGWITLFAWICSCASNPALIVNIIIGLASFNYPEYEAKRWHVTLLMWAITIAPFIGNFWFRKFLSPLEALGAILHVTFFTTSLITLVVTARRSSTDYVFNTLTSGVSGWNNPAASWGIGLLTVTYPLTGFDGVLHMSDEVKKARVRVPRSMVTSVVMNAVMQFAYLIAVLFCIGDVDVTSSAVLPITQVFYQATGSKAVTNLFVAMMGVIIFIAFFNVFASDSRLVWAFSRDKGLPFSHIFAKVHPTLKMPLNALLLIGACIFILALINIGSSTAFNALISLPALGLYVSYFFPILFLFIRRFSRSHPTPIPWGPFKLGMWGAPVNLAAMCYIIFVVIWMPMPTTLPVTKDNFNYAGPILGGVILLAALDWCISGRKRFQVPIAHHRPDDD